MKRCPQCEFVYEDGQSLCDMDGRDLVYDIRPLSGNTSTARISSTMKSGSRRSAAALIGIVLGVVLSAIGYASVERALSQNSDLTVPAVTGEQPSSLSPVALTPAVAESPSHNEKPGEIASPSDIPPGKVQAATPGSQPLTRKRVETTSTAERAVVNNETTPVRPETTRTRKESKLSSLFKKTKRILKKPF